MIKLAISGARGRMGQRITALAAEDKAFKIVALLENPQHPDANSQKNGLTISPDPSVMKKSNVLIEFTSPVATMEHLDAAQKFRIKMVIGTTGLNEIQIEQIKAASKRIPIVFSSNMSVGVNILFATARDLARRCAGRYQMRIVEAHHIHKKDAPSGTAKTLTQIIEQAAKDKVVDIQSIREGETIGDHEIIFESPVDTIKISHHAKTRDIFAAGALVAAKFLAKKSKGLFTMEDVLGIKNKEI